MMPTLRVINAAQVSELLEPGQLRSALEVALVAQAGGKANVPPRIAAAAPNGMVAAMPGYLDGVGLATKIVSIFPGNVGLPSHMGVIVYFDVATGMPLALLDAEKITEDRTAMAAAIATDLLARADASVLTIVGAGAQGKAHVEAFGALRDWQEVRVVSRNRNSATVLAAQARTAFTPKVTVANFNGFEEAVRGADVVALCTHAAEAVIDPAWVGPGCHVSSVGSQAELPVGLVGVGPLVVDHLGAVTTEPPAGAAEIQHVLPDSVTELGALIASGDGGRTGSDQITVYKSTGHAVQDIAAARLVYDLAQASSVGVLIDL